MAISVYKDTCNNYACMYIYVPCFLKKHMQQMMLMITIMTRITHTAPTTMPMNAPLLTAQSQLQSSVTNKKGVYLRM